MACVIILSKERGAFTRDSNSQSRGRTSSMIDRCELYSYVPLTFPSCLVPAPDLSHLSWLTKEADSLNIVLLSLKLYQKVDFLRVFAFLFVVIHRKKVPVGVMVRWRETEWLLRIYIWDLSTMRSSFNMEYRGTGLKLWGMKSFFLSHSVDIYIRKCFKQNWQRNIFHLKQSSLRRSGDPIWWHTFFGHVWSTVWKTLL